MADQNTDIQEKTPEKELAMSSPKALAEEAPAEKNPAEASPAAKTAEVTEPPADKAGEKPPKKVPRPRADAPAEGGAEEGAAEEKPRPKREKAAKEPKPQVPLPPLALWRNEQFEPLGEAQIVKGPYELLVRKDEPKEGNARRPITGKLEVEGQFNLPLDLLNEKAVIKIGHLLLHVYVISTSNTGGSTGDVASFIIVKELRSEDEARALYPLAA
jgi:hypothetical protein